eukprot:gnl/TRDRNA2_/TRDRNA2_35142_c0_seq1.p1 gnl/TRDRNA2_/TRDRNA2_35142_c0~~gnl/TRDRNA2_/TRDRNA2_35142_c0_seq1.p1  ORF type:complete len:342 (-),score=66.50 gnl/TRDRNA2_/TRDRNA2_35142_c0_seq1:165-1190(-)
MGAQCAVKCDQQPCCKEVSSTALGSMILVSAKPSGAGFSDTNDPLRDMNIVKTGEDGLTRESTVMTRESTELPVYRDAAGGSRGIYLPPKPADRTWRDEWVALRMEELRLQGQEYLAQQKHFEPGAPAHIDQMLKHLTGYVQWQVSAGWDRQGAEAYTLLASCGRAALSRALREHSDVYAASQNLVVDILSERAKQLKEPAPPAYRNLSGKFGLATEDVGWQKMVDNDLQVGMSFTSSAIVAGYRGQSYFPDDKGFHVGVNRGGRVVYECQDSDVVCFRSRAKDADGFHSLIQAAAGTYDLPPLALVTLESVKEAGAWEVYGTPLQRRLIVVSVTYGSSAR